MPQLNIQNIESHLYEVLMTQAPKERRNLLLSEMETLTNKDIHCFKCTGTCCTMTANSMQITPLEAFEILLSLKVNSQNVNELKEALKTNISHYRLDHEVFLSKKGHTHLRKTYTCPFFSPGPKGCTINKELKPYGCLGFNPRIENDNGGNCHSDLPLLESRENLELANEILANDFLRKEFNFTWEKCEIPKAVLAFLVRLFPTPAAAEAK
jgi:Fe-S-cluster containining protein